MRFPPYFFLSTTTSFPSKPFEIRFPKIIHPHLSQPLRPFHNPRSPQRRPPLDLPVVTRVTDQRPSPGTPSFSITRCTRDKTLFLRFLHSSHCAITRRRGCRDEFPKTKAHCKEETARFVPRLVTPGSTIDREKGRVKYRLKRNGRKKTLRFSGR